MAGQTGKSGLLAQLGGVLAKGMAENLSRPPELGNPQMPGGVENGIAQLRECKIDIFKEGKNQGKPYFSAYGIAVSPDKIKDKPVAGLRTIIGPEPLCETPDATGKRKTVGEHYNWYLDQLRGLGLDQFIQEVFQKAVSITDSNAQGLFIEQQLLLGMQSLCSPPQKGQPDGRPFFKFRTSDLPSTDINQVGRLWVVTQGKRTLGTYHTEDIAKKKHPYAGQGSGRVYHEWCGFCDYQPHAGLPTNPTEVQDDSGVSVAQPLPNGVGAGGVSSSSHTMIQLDTADADADGAISELVTKASSGDDQAKIELDRLAKAAGATEEQIDQAQNWQEVANLITGNASSVPPDTATVGSPTPTSITVVADSPAATKEEEEATQHVPVPEVIDEELPPPAVGEKYKYQILNKDGTPAKARNGQPRPLVDCVVKSVDLEAFTVDLTSSDEKTVFGAIPWDSLLPPE